MIGEAGHGLDFAAHQQRVLMRDEQAAVEGNLRPAARGEQGIVERAAVGQGAALRLSFRDLNGLARDWSRAANLPVGRRDVRARAKAGRR